MFDEILLIVTSVQFLIAACSAVAVSATAYTLVQPLFSRDKLATRIKNVAVEREQIRARERARLTEEAKRAGLRQEPKAYMRRVVDKFDLRSALADSKTTAKLRVAGFRGQAPLVAFLFARVTLPLIFFAVGAFYIFVVIDWQQPFVIKLTVAIVVAYIGFYAPNLYVSNTASKRQLSIGRAWPDALDLLLICVESGMSVEAAFRKVAEEVGTQSAELAEELMLTTAELSYLESRRQAYENLAARSGLDSVRSAMTSLIQADRYGTPLGQSLRVLAQENRDERMMAAEQKAAALPPKLTVPMILFFLPVLFIVILGPAGIELMAQR
ncbi:MAG: type II secretion system F family protein [Alphaproteobacteria bacterium]